MSKLMAICMMAAMVTSSVVMAETAYPIAWTQQLGTSGHDYSYSVAIDSSGNAFISGYTTGSLDGTNAGGNDAFLSKYDSGGNLQWTQQLGTSASDYSYSVAIDSSGNAFISGFTTGSLDGTNAGAYDAFLVKFEAPPVPLPATLNMLLMGGMAVGGFGLIRRRRK